MRRVRLFSLHGRILMLLALLFSLGLGTIPTKAVEVPPAGVLTYIQTNGPYAWIGQGDWYTSSANGVVTAPNFGYHYIQFNIPCSWPAALPVQLDLFSPEINSNTPLADEVNASDNIPDNTFYELYGPGTVIVSPNQPGPGGPGSLGAATTYTPSNATPSWVRFRTLAAPVVCGNYVIRVQTANNDENSWRLRVGSDNDNNPLTDPPANYDNPDGIAGTNDEITIGLAQTTYQHDVADSGGNDVRQCLTLYQFVQPNVPSVTFHNFDLDYVANSQTVRVRYYPPSATADPLAQSGGTLGTSSTPTVWNGGTQTNRGTGDVINNPEPGWWKIVTCINNHNQYIQEAQNGSATYYVQPPTPVMAIGKTDGKTITTVGDTLNYTIPFTNTSNTTPTPGAALNVTITDTLPVNTTYVPNSCAVNAPYTGTCTFNGTQVIFKLNEAVNAGASGSVKLSVTVNANPNPATTVTNNVQLTYKDQLGNNYPPVTAQDIDQIVAAPPILTLVKDDGGISSYANGIIPYTLSYSNIGASTATGVVITETVPARTTFYAAASTPGWSCANGAVVGSVCTFNVGTLTVNQTGSVVFAVKVNNELGNEGQPEDVVNTATINCSNNCTPVTSTERTPLLIPDFEILKASDPAPGTLVYIGDVITYTVTVTSTGPVSATNMVVTDFIPDGTTYLPNSAVPAVASGPDPLKWNLGSIPPTEVRKVSFQVTVVNTPTDGAIFNIASACGTNMPCKDSNEIQHPFSPTAITLVSFSATSQSNGIAVNWTTSSEFDTWGFRILRSTTSSRSDAVVVTPALIAAQGRNKGGASYEWLDSSAVAGIQYRYWLQEVELSGATNEYGPAQATLQSLNQQRIYLPFVTR